MLGIVGAGAIALGFRINPLLVLLSAGAFMLVFRAALQPKGSVACLTPLLGATSEFRLLSTAGAASTVSLWPMFLFFLKVGAVMFGSGYVLLAFLRADLVEHWHWLTESQLLDAVAVGQFTPGPFLTTATFIGYVLGGPQAALVATVAIFLPSFVLVAISGPLMPRLRQSRLARAFLDGVNVASLALLAVVTWQLGRDRAGGLADHFAGRGLRRLASVVSRQLDLADPGWSGLGVGEVCLPNRPLIPERGENRNPGMQETNS